MSAPAFATNLEAVCRMSALLDPFHNRHVEGSSSGAQRFGIGVFL
jgi:hypothetical protein